MSHFPKSLSAWNTPDFKIILKQEIAQLDASALPLQQGLTTGSYAIDTHREVMINGVSEDTNSIRVRAGIFYAGIIAGCSCADDPTPIDEHNEYCEVQLEINKVAAETTITLLTE